MSTPLAAAAKGATSAPSAGFWDGKLGYAHAWTATFTFLAIGLALHLTAGVPAGSPYLGAFLGAPVVGAMVAVRVWRKTELVHWLSGIPLAVASTSIALFLALLGGVMPSAFWTRLGMGTLWESWPFLLASEVVMINLGAAVSKRAWPLTKQNATFLLSHLGLLIAFAGGGVSACLMQKSRIAVFPGVHLNKAQTAEGGEMDLPFSIQLKEFHMENFPPNLAVAKSADDIQSGSHFAATGLLERVGDYDLKVEKHLAKAIYDGQTYREAAWKTAAPASFVSAWKDGKKVAEGWISSGSRDVPPAFVPLPDERVVAMTAPRPKKYSSRVEVKTHEGVRTETIEVNKPLRVGSWTVYQVSYDEEAGAASEYSVLEAVEDRGLPVVYLGMGLVVLGAFVRLWEGVEKGQ